MENNFDLINSWFPMLLRLLRPLASKGRDAQTFILNDVNKGATFWIYTLHTRLTRVVADSGAGSTIETFRNSELIDAIFKFFALKFSERTSIKVLENKCENKASLWTDFKNSFAWLTGMKNMIFRFYNFFCSGHFLIIFRKIKDQKMTGAKKVVKTKNHIFHARQPREGIFEIRS